ncbi:MAG: metal-dependent transcriptional regulator [Clostridia bacterium]
MLYQSGEDYLETILLLQNEKGYVRSIDIATKLGFSKPSISRAMSNLKKEEYIEMDVKGYITFTEKGLAMASKIYNRHKIITEFLMVTLDVSHEIAEEDACKIEHVISHEAFMKMQEFLKNKKQ